MALGVVGRSVGPPLGSEKSQQLLWTAMKFCTDIHGLQRMNPYDFDDSLTFLCAENVYLSNTKYLQN